MFPFVIVHRSVCSFWCVAVCFCLWPGWMSALLGNSLCWRVNQANHPGAHFGLPYIYSCVAVILYQIVALISLSYSVLSSVPVFSSLILVWITCCHCCSWISMTTGSSLFHQPFVVCSALPKLVTSSSLLYNIWPSTFDHTLFYGLDITINKPLTTTFAWINS